MRFIITCAGFFVLPVLCGAERPNVIVIYTDDQGYGDASCLNPVSKFKTPNLDRLAAEGITFTDGHCSDTVCTPSRYGLLTGRYSWRTVLKRGVFGAERKCLIEDGRVTVASLFRDRQYNTAMVGKWHLGMDFPGEKMSRDWTQPVRDMPLDKGFDYFWGIPASMNYGVLAWFEGRFAKTPPTLWTRKKPNQIAISDYRIMPPYETEPIKPSDLEVAADFVDSECLTRFTDMALAWLQSKVGDAKRGKPFFLYLPYTSPHKPVIPIDQFRGQSDAGAYGDFMIETDHHVGRLLEFLDNEGLTENTLVFFSSDNGPENTWRERIVRYEHYSSGPYRDGKRSIYEGGHRVPFILRWPRVVQAGRQWDQPVCQTDLLTTFADMLDVALPDNAAEDSISLLPILKADELIPRRLPVIHHASQGRFAIREGRWKLVMPHKRRSRELYDLQKDPGEQNNVVADHPQVAKQLHAKISEIVISGRTRPGKSLGNDTELWADVDWAE